MPHERQKRIRDFRSSNNIVSVSARMKNSGHKMFFVVNESRQMIGANNFEMIYIYIFIYLMVYSVSSIGIGTYLPKV